MRNDTKAYVFSRTAKEAIAERDSINGWPCCIRCGRPASEYLGYSNAHYIPRSQGGLGIPENGLTLCPNCHLRYDQTAHREADREFYREYLMGHYPDWDETNLIYHKTGGSTNGKTFAYKD